MKCDIILAGVGGQGILSIAATIGLAAVEEESLPETVGSSWNEPAGRRCAVAPQAVRQGDTL